MNPIKYDEIRIEITGACNLRCRTCHASDRNTPQALREQLSTEEILSLIGQAGAIGVKEFELIGGEPFLHKDIWSIIDACSGIVTICTNGHFFTPENIASLRSRPKVKEFCVSIDGVESHERIRTGSQLSVVQEGLARVKRELPDIKVLIQTTCTQENIDELDALYALLQDESIRPYAWSINLFWKAGRGVENYSSLQIKDWRYMMQRFASLIVRHREDGSPFVFSIYNTYNSLIADEDHEEYEEYQHMDATVHPCVYHLQKPCIRTDGTVEFCNSLHHVSKNVREAGSLRAALESDAFQQFYRTTIGDLQTCPSCRYIELCGGGCRGEAVTHLGDMKQVDPIACEMMPLIEEVIMPVLTEKERQRYQRLIRQDLAPPPRHFSLVVLE